MKWIVDAKAFEYDRHYSDCRKENRPFIKARINLETGNHLVFLDMATCNYKLTEKKMKQIQELFNSESSAPKHCEITSEFCTFDGILQQKLNYFLSDLYDIVQITV